jgi:hypothetical protein
MERFRLGGKPTTQIRTGIASRATDSPLGDLNNSGHRLLERLGEQIGDLPLVEIGVASQLAKICMPIKVGHLGNRLGLFPRFS